MYRDTVEENFELSVLNIYKNTTDVNCNMTFIFTKKSVPPSGAAPNVSFPPSVLHGKSLPNVVLKDLQGRQATCQALASEGVAAPVTRLAVWT